MGARCKKEIIGKTDNDFFPRKLVNSFATDDRQVMVTGKEIVNHVEIVTSAGGKIQWNVTNKIPLRDTNGNIVGLVGINRDLYKANVSLRRFRAMSAVLEHIDAHYGTPITMQDLASLVHLSISQFDRRFKALFHMTPLQYLNKTRINKACLMLTETDAKITEIASKCGFYDHSHFIRHLKQAIGMSPLLYRKQHSETQ